MRKEMIATVGFFVYLAIAIAWALGIVCNVSWLAGAYKGYAVYMVISLSIIAFQAVINYRDDFKTHSQLEVENMSLKHKLTDCRREAKAILAVTSPFLKDNARLKEALKVYYEPDSTEAQ